MRSTVRRTRALLLFASVQWALLLAWCAAPTTAQGLGHMRKHGHNHQHRHQKPDTAASSGRDKSESESGVLLGAAAANFHRRPTPGPTMAPTPTGPTQVSAEEEGGGGADEERGDGGGGGGGGGGSNNDDESPESPPESLPPPTNTTTSDAPPALSSLPLRDSSPYDVTWLPGDEPNSTFPGLSESFARLIPLAYRGEAAQNLATAAALLAEWPKEQPRACIAILAFPLGCPEGCHHNATRGGGGGNNNHQHRVCNASVPLRRTLKDLNRLLYNRARAGVLPKGWVPYPIVVFHTDWPKEVRDWVGSFTRATVLWQQVAFDEQTLPFADGQYGGTREGREAVLQFLRPYHPHGLHFTSPGYHGYGYRLMCRFFAGLVMHAPPLSLFDYYWRLDNGDSQVGRIREDPFRALAAARGSLGVHRLPGAGGSQFRSERSWHGATRGLVRDFGAAEGRPLSKLFHESHVKSFLGRPDPLLYYNNFEILDMRRFRGPTHWRLFLAAERKQMFLCPPDGGAGGAAATCDAASTRRKCRPREGKGWSGKCHGWGDADFRTLAATLKEVTPRGLRVDVVPLQYAVSYNHPVPWC